MRLDAEDTTQAGREVETYGRAEELSAMLLRVCGAGIPTGTPCHSDR